MNSFRLLLTAVVLAIAITAVFISTTLQAQEGQEDDVFINTPTSTDIYHLFPRGSDAVLSFGTAIATGPVGTTITYSIEYELDGTVTPLPDLFLTEVVDETDGTITYSKSATPTIEQYRTAYGTTGDEAIINATITATDGTTTDTLDFNIHIQHDQSAQTDSPAVYQSYNRWKIPTLYEVYEGPNAVASFKWSASHSDTAVDRRWSMAEEPDGQQATVSCNYDGATIDEVHINWPNTDHDSYLFNPVNETTDPPSHPSGTITVSFDNSNPDPEVGDTPLKYPDFENPHDHDTDNTYHLRVINDNDVDTDSIVGCSGSAIDITVKIKDVGAPNPPTNITGNFNADGNEINLSWTAPTTFDDNGITVDFPHSFFNPSKYLVRYRANDSDSDDWSTVLESTTTPIDITGLDQTRYFVEVAAVNDRGHQRMGPHHHRYAGKQRPHRHRAQEPLRHRIQIPRRQRRGHGIRPRTWHRPRR